MERPVAESIKREYVDHENNQLVSEITGTWEAVTKDADGEAHIHTLHKHSKKVRPLFDGDDIENLLVRKAAPTIIRPTRRKAPTRNDQLTLVAGDAQVPFHDQDAFDRFQQEVVDSQPDNIVFVGDMVDLNAMSRFGTRPEWVGSTQSAIDEYHNFLAQTRANAPNANIHVVHGNHEQRMDDYIRKNAMEVLGLRRANMPKELAVLTLQYLVRYDDLDIQAIDGYPNGTLWLENNLKFTHGTNVAKGGSNAAKYLREERETTIYGHTHRMELAYRTFPQRIGAVTIAAASPGCLSMIDGSVPGYRHTIDSEGQVVKRAEDWQQGVLRIEHSRQNHQITPVRFPSFENGELEAS